MSPYSTGDNDFEGKHVHQHYESITLVIMILFWRGYKTYKDEDVALSKVCEQHKRKDDGKANGDPNLWAKITGLSLTWRSLWKSVIFELE